MTTHAFEQRALVLYQPAGSVPIRKTNAVQRAAVCAVDGDFDDCQRITKQMIHRDGVGVEFRWLDCCHRLATLLGPPFSAPVPSSLFRVEIWGTRQHVFWQGKWGHP